MLNGHVDIRTNELIEEFAERYLFANHFYDVTKMIGLKNLYSDAIELYTGEPLKIAMEDRVLSITHMDIEEEFILHKGQLRRLA